MEWFRFNSGTLDNLKTQRLPAELFKVWINLLCLANEGTPRGCLPPPKNIAFRLRLGEPVMRKALAALRRASLLETCPDGCLRPHEWDDYQRPLTNAERQALFRLRQIQKGLENDGVTPGVTKRNDNVTLHVTTRPNLTRPDQTQPDPTSPTVDDNALISLATDLYENSLGSVNPMTADLLRELVDDLQKGACGAEALAEVGLRFAFAQTVRNKGRSMAYVGKVAQAWIDDGCPPAPGKGKPDVVDRARERIRREAGQAS